MAKRQSSAFNARQYMLSEDYEVFYYSDTHFRSVGSHSHDYYELYFFEEGAVTMVIDEKPCPLRPGDVIVIPPGIDHRAILTDPEKPYRRFVFWQSKTFLKALEARSPDYGYLLRRAEEILREAEGCRGEYERLVCIGRHLARNVRYMEDAEKRNTLKDLEARTVIGPLLNRRCVCAGYAKAFKLLKEDENILKWHNERIAKINF